uniref:glucuronosyl-galactosyl-proteoglycan 4-alpha-N-acetylglucosaminyltransferase n=1 Tax=Timema californicum TaxID=61474 RepID=A0A7R9JCF4_TIMCA|nr:unnamed protein product [Timema californicum]
MTLESTGAYHPLNGREALCHWLGHIKLSRIIVLVFMILIIVPLITHYFLSKVESSVPNGDIHRTRSKLEAFEDFSTLRASDLKLRIEEMLRIKGSVSAELRDLEAKRQRLQIEVVGFSQKIDDLKTEVIHQQTELERLKISVEQAQVSQREALQRNTPDLALPRKLLPTAVPGLYPPPETRQSSACRMYNCFDHSRCSLTSGFPVYLYDPDRYPVITLGWEVEGFVKTTLKQTLGYNPHFTTDPVSACIYLVLVGESLATMGPNLRNFTDSTLQENLLHDLPYWGGDGRNHVLLNFARSGSVRGTRELSTGGRDIFHKVNTGRAMFIQSTFVRSNYRPGFDVVSPPILGPPGGDTWQDSPMILVLSDKKNVKLVMQLPNRPLKTEAIVPEAEPEESLGPIEPPYPSPKFKRNYTFFLTQGHEVWNDWGDPFKLYPQLPFDTILPSDAKFIGSGVGFRPIGRGAGGAGKEFCESLGGNSPREQFTIVMLTYEREQVLINSLSRLYGLPYLNKVIVVWNSPRPPLEDLRWPEIGVPVHVIKASRNSLNNRFLPYDAIETEAILSVDDDAHLRHDEIMFGFRVWREQRDRVVGFPGRFHAWDLNHQGWLYNSNYSCELSMVLTGAAFIHKYYTYLYSYWLPQAVRDKVDEYMNCEDIAMNFLVSHITRKPPVKVTSRWTFRCPGCPVSLSEDDTHFQERHKCINFFTQEQLPVGVWVSPLHLGPVFSSTPPHSSLLPWSSSRPPTLHRHILLVIVPLSIPLTCPYHLSRVWLHPAAKHPVPSRLHPLQDSNPSRQAEMLQVHLIAKHPVPSRLHPLQDSDPSRQAEVLQVHLNLKKQSTTEPATRQQKARRHCSVVKLVTSRMQGCCFFWSFPKNLFYSMRRLVFLHSNVNTSHRYLVQSPQNVSYVYINYRLALKCYAFLHC